MVLVVAYILEGSDSTNIEIEHLQAESTDLNVEIVNMTLGAISTAFLKGGDQLCAPGIYPQTVRSRLSQKSFPIPNLAATANDSV